MNLPNILTATRFLLIPLFVIVFFAPIEKSVLYATYIFILAGITDILDGYIARKYNIITRWGQAMDPLADKLMQITVLLCFTIKKYLPLWVILIVGLKETLMIIGGIFLYTKKDKRVIPSNKYGKVATVAIYLAVLTTAFSLPYSYLFIKLAIVTVAYAFFKYSLIGIKEVKKTENKF